MIRHFLSKEVFETIRGPKFLITFILCLILIVVSVYSGYELYRSEVNWYETAVAQNKLALENLGSYSYLKFFGSKVIRPPERLSIFVKGVDSAVGKSADISESPKIVLRDSREGLNPIFAVFGELDLAFIVNVILSLFAILFSYNAISGERELGTLKVVLSNRVSRASFIMGKAAGGLIILFTILLVPLIISLIVLNLLFNVHFDLDEWGRIGLLVLVFCLYVTVFYMIGIFVSALTRNSMISFLLCLAFWVLSVVILPKASVEFAGSISPAPSIDEVEAKRAEIKRNYFKEFGVELQRRLTEHYNDPTITEKDDLAVEMQVTSELQAKYGAVEQEVLRDYERKQQQLQRTAETLARSSPTSCASFAQARLTLTDVDLSRRYVDDLRRYRKEFLEYADDKILKNPRQSRGGYRVSMRGDENEGYRFEVEVPTYKISIGDMPEFRQEQVRLESTLEPILPDLTLLALYALGFFGLAFLAFTRYDVR